MSEFTDVNAPIVEQPVQEVAAQDNPVYAADLLPVEAPKADAQQQPKPTEVQQEKPKPAPAKTQEEIDRLWDAFCEEGEPSQCGWVTDKYGLSWQIVPRRLIELVRDPDRAKARRVAEAMLKMVKLDIAGLEAAAKG